ncbi:MAG: chlorite dismutase family protein [Elusimicrobiota bacterium]
MNPIPAISTKEDTMGERGKAHLYMDLLFLRLEARYRALMANEKVVCKQEFLAAYDRSCEQLSVAAYALTGLRADCDVLLLRLSPHLENFQAMSCHLQESGLGKYLVPVRSFLGTVRAAEYAPPQEPEREDAKAPGAVGNGKYLFVTPAPADAAAALEGAKRPAGGRVHVLDGRGLGEEPFVVAFETDDPAAFRELLSGWDKAPQGPTYVCLLKDIHDIVDGLG